MAAVDTLSSRDIYARSFSFTGAGPLQGICAENA